MPDYDELRQYVNDEVLNREGGFDEWVLLKALEKLGTAFNEFVSSTWDGKTPKAPSVGDIAKARSYLPPHCSLSYRKMKS
jgi:hypothetical protein